MAVEESWSKDLRCPLCGLAGTAQLSHPDESASRYETKTIIDECPKGFEVREDEDDSNIFRFFCIADGVPADE